MLLRRTTPLAAALGAAFILSTAPVQAQSIGESPATPELSLAASVTQTVGVTEMSVTYSSPAARDREIWGALLPYGELWRAGANAPTRVSFDQAVTIGGSEVPAGEYTLIVIPEADTWTAIFNTDSSGRGYAAYNADEDVARVEAPVVEAAPRERLAFTFDNTTNDTTHLTLDWAGAKASFPITTDTDAIVEAEIQSALADLWRPPFNAARYLLNEGEDLDRAAELMAQSISIEATWWNNWFMAEVQAALGEHGSAREFAEQSIALGEGDRVFDNFFRARVDAALAEWPRR